MMRFFAFITLAVTATIITIKLINKHVDKKFDAEINKRSQNELDLLTKRQLKINDTDWNDMINNDKCY